MRATQALPFLLASFVGTANADSEVIGIHGSGTTNPSKCIWHVMSLFEERSRVSTRLTYRAVGSSTGQIEFLGKDNGGTVLDDNGSVVETLTNHVPYNDFGAGDIPIKTASYDLLNNAEGHGISNVAHLPFAMSSVSWFHNIPGVPDGDGGIKLSPCLLARIYGGKIPSWNSPEIIEENKHLEDILSELEDDIFVARRVKGSSSTKSITQFMNSKCPAEWEDKYVSSELSLKKGNDWHLSTTGCEGSGGMTDCILGNAGSIGYIDSGHGWSEGLKEVNVQNEDGFYLTSRFAHENQGIANAALAGNAPNSTTADWGGTNFLNKEGRYTWPIVVMSYFYVRTDIHRFIPDEEERGLLKLFLEAMYDDNYFGACEDLGFSKPPEAVKNMAVSGIENDLDWDFSVANGEKNMWTFEYDTDAYVGQGKYVISKKRRSLAGVSIEDIAGAEKRLNADVDFLKESFHEMFVTEEGELRNVWDELEAEKKNTRAALILAALSWTMWMCVFVGWLVLKLTRRK